MANESMAFFEGAEFNDRLHAVAHEGLAATAVIIVSDGMSGGLR